MSAWLGLLLASASPQPITVRDLVELADLSSVAISPDERQVAFRVERPSVARNDVRIDWYVAPLDGSGPARRVAGGGSQRFDSAGVSHHEPPVWSPDGRALYFRATRDGATQVWRADVARGRAAQVTADPGDVVDFALVEGGKMLRYRAGPTRMAVAQAEAEARDHGVRVDASVDLALGVSGGVRIDGRDVSQRLTGQWFERRGLLQDTPLRTVTLRLANPARTRPALEQPDPAKPPPCTPSMCAETNLAWTAPIPGSAEWIAALRDAHGSYRLVRVRPDGGWSVVVRADGLLAGGRDGSVPCAIGSRAAVCVAASAESPPRLVRVALGGGGSTATLFDPNPGPRRRVPASVKRLTWRDAQGQAFAGLLVEPGTPGRPPPGLVIHYYRCDGFLRGGTGDELPIYPLVESGIAVLCINAPFVVRPSATVEANYARALSGIGAIIEQLAKDGRIDRRRVGMQGLSFGSEATMWVLRHSQLLAAASIASAQLEPAYYWFNAVRGRDAPATLARSWGIGPPGSDAAGWRRASAALDSESIRAPLLMQLPELEARWSVELFARLSRSKTPVELFAYPGARHIKSAPRQKASVYQRNLDWFRYWLDAAREADPAKRGQNRRWKAVALRAHGNAARP